MLVTAILTFFFTLPSQSFSAESHHEWANLGDNLNPYPSDFIGKFSLSADPRKNPVLAFSHTDRETYASETLVMRWRNKHWEMIGEPLAGLKNPSIGQDAEKNLYLCAAGRGGIVSESDDIKGGPYVFRWDGQQWQPIGGSIAKESGNWSRRRFNVNACDGIVLDSSGAPIVTWSSHVGSKAHFAFAARWDDDLNQWVSLGESLTSFAGRATRAYIDIDLKDRVYIATHRPGGSYGGNNTTEVWRWNGEKWRQLGGNMPNTRTPVIAVYDNKVYLALTDVETGQIKVMRWKGKRWKELASPGYGENPVLDFTLRGKVVTAYIDKENPETPFVRVKLLRKKRWRPVGNVVSELPTNIYSELDIAIDAKGRPTVAWSESDFSEETTGLFAKRYHKIKK